MNKRVHIIFIILIALMIALAFVLFPAHKAENGKPAQERSAPDKKILYWTCGMHPSVKAEEPGKCPICSMPLIPVPARPAGGYEDAQGEKKETAPAEKDEDAYYGCGVKEEGHCPHCDEGKADAACICGGHSFVEKGHTLKACPICNQPLKKIMPPPVMASDAAAVSRVRLTPQQASLAGVRTERVTKKKLVKEIRTVGRIAFDPGLAVAQEEFLTALVTREKVAGSPDAGVIARAEDLVEKSRLRLRLLGMSEGEIAQLEKNRAAHTSLILPEDKAWVYADVYEVDLGWVKEDQDVRVAAEAYPGEVFRGVIKAVSPVLDSATRSARARLEIDNPGKKLKPEMYVDVTVESVYRDAAGSAEVLSVSREAVLDTGLRKIVYVEVEPHTFIGKEITVGPQANADAETGKQIFYPVLVGLAEGETVVTKGNFLIDSQSQLTGGASVQWGGATEIKAEGVAGGTPSGGSAPDKTQHRH